MPIATSWSWVLSWHFKLQNSTNTVESGVQDGIPLSPVSAAQAPLGQARWLVRRDPPGKGPLRGERMLALAF